MIIVKTPYRLPLAGGGTDHEFYYKKKNGLLISATFDQYIYCLITKRKIDKKILVQTTNSQFSNNLKKLKHEIIREVLKYFKIKNQIQIGTFATVPTSSGLGSSSSLIVGLINGISKILKKKYTKKRISEIAYYIERKILKYEGGWQDQIISSFGGINKISINKKGKFRVKKLNIPRNKINVIQNKLILVFTDETRNSSRIIKKQKLKIKNSIKIYDKLKKFVLPLERCLFQGNYSQLGKIFHQHWLIKKKLSNQISNSFLDNFYLKLLKNKDFIGGKIIGAGGGGFFLMVTKNRFKSEKFLKKNNFKFMRVNFDFNGSSIIKDSYL